MRTSLQHLSLNVSNFAKSVVFYKDLLGYFEFKIKSEGGDYIGFTNGTTDIWLGQAEPKYIGNKLRRKNPGLNHLAFGVSSREEVDKFTVEFLRPHNIPTLYNSPKLFPQYTPNYYAVYFEDPDRLKIEILTGD